MLDGRAARGKRYELAALLVVLVVAKLAGMQSLLGASEWIQDQQERWCAHLRLSWKRMPCANTYKYVLARLDSQQVNAQFAAWLVRTEAQSRCGEEPSRLVLQARGRSVHLASDGKTLKGTGKQIYEGEEPQQQVVPVDEVQTGMVLEQCPLAQDHNARPYAQAHVDGGLVQRAPDHCRCCSERSRVWSPGTTGRRRWSADHQRQYASDTGGSGALF